MNEQELTFALIEAKQEALNWQEKYMAQRDVIGFANKEIRADANNLVLLCVKCHRFVHSKKNINGEFIGKEVQE